MKNIYIITISTFLLINYSMAAPSWLSESNWGINKKPKPVKYEGKYEGKSINKKRITLSPHSPDSHNFSVNLGHIFLMGDLSEDYSDSIGFRFNYTYGVSDLFAFDTSAGYSNHSEGKYSLTTLLTGLRTNLSWYDKVVPFLNFGLGFYKPKYDYKDETGDNLSPILFGLHFGPGIDLHISRRFFFGASLILHDIFDSTKNTENGSKEIGGTYTSFFVHLGFVL